MGWSLAFGRVLPFLRRMLIRGRKGDMLVSHVGFSSSIESLTTRLVSTGCATFLAARLSWSLAFRRALPLLRRMLIRGRHGDVLINHVGFFSSIRRLTTRLVSTGCATFAARCRHRRCILFGRCRLTKYSGAVIGVARRSGGSTLGASLNRQIDGWSRSRHFRVCVDCVRRISVCRRLSKAGETAGERSGEI